MNPRDFPVRHSRLKNMAQSPAHYLHGLGDVDMDGNYLDDAGSDSQQLGTAVHSLVLGGKPIIVFPGGKRQGKAWDEFEAADAGKSNIVTASQWAKAQSMATAVLSDPNAARVLQGQHEHRVRWDIGGRACVSTLDAYQAGSHITDLKTCKSAKPSKFLWDARRFHYDSQLAFYSDAVGGVPDHYLVAVESSPPFPVVVYRMAPETIEMGRALYRSWWERLMGCEENDDWPGYSRLIEELRFPEEGDGLDWEAE